MQMSLVHGQQGLVCWLRNYWTRISGPRLWRNTLLSVHVLGQESNCSNKESITENFENTGAVVSSKLIEIRKLPSPALFKIILKLEAFKDTKQHIVSTTITESQMTIKYSKDVLTMLAVVSAVRENDLDHTSYARHSKYQHVNLNNLLRGEKSILKNLITNGCGAWSSGGSFSTIHWDLAVQYLSKWTEGTVDSFRTDYIRHPYRKKIDKNLYIHSKMRTFCNGLRNWWRSCWWVFFMQKK